MEKIIWIGLIIATIIIVAIKTLNILYKTLLKKEAELCIAKSIVIKPTIEYTEYVNVSKRTSVPNTPCRTEGDFWEFILPCAKKTSDSCIENTLFYVNCGES